jgi:hypothetical protein
MIHTIELAKESVKQPTVGSLLISGNLPVLSKNSKTWN